jgi:hypothetical protein
MAIGNLYHTGYVSYCKYDDLKEWLTTTENNQIINFLDSDGKSRHLNSLVIEAETTNLYIRILPGDYILFIPAGEARHYDFEDITSIQIMNLAGAKLRWSGMFW